MKISVIQQRLESKRQQLEAKHNTLEKKQALKAKKIAALKQLGVDYDVCAYADVPTHEGRNLYFDIQMLEEDIKSLLHQMNYLDDDVANLEAMLEEAENTQEFFKKEIPHALQVLGIELVERWDKYDIDRKQQLTLEYRALGHFQFLKKYKEDGYRLLNATEQQIHESNNEAAKILVLDLYNRIRVITGSNIESWANIVCTNGNLGPVLNGFVKDDKGTAKVESIYASGPIQRLHIRTLVHEVK